MYFHEEQEMRRQLSKTQERLEELQSDVEFLVDENERLNDAIHHLYAAFHSMLPHLSEKVRDENETLRTVLS